MVNIKPDGSTEQRNAFIKLFMTNAFQIVKAVGDSSAWDMIAIGSDFQGSIGPISCFKDALGFMDFRYSLKEFLKRIKDKTIILDQENYLFTNEEVLSLLYDLPPEVIADKLLAQNTMNFLKRNFK